MERYFEKISFDQFKRDICCGRKLYDSYVLPKRGTKNSCGYDFYAISDYVIKAGEVLKIPTGYKVKCMDDEFLMVVVRSSVGVKYNVRMCNQVGIIDSDYYNNRDNEGHIWVVLKNEGNCDFVLKRGDRYCQGIFLKYFTDSDNLDNVRCGGFGSTD